MIPDPGTPTLDQLRVFLTVVDVGSFAGAARKLHRATSVVSYSIANLEMQLGVSLFDRKTTRKPQLTDAGRTVLAEARTIYNGIDGLRAKVRGLLHGLEAEVHLVLDVMMPGERVVDALKAFREEFATVSLHLHVEALGAVAQKVLDRGASLGVSGPLTHSLDGIERIGVGSVALIPVARPTTLWQRPGPMPRVPVAATCSWCSPIAPDSPRTRSSRSSVRALGAWLISAPSTCCCAKALAGATCPSIE